MRFLRGLAAHNKKPWFESHRVQYESDVKAPMQSLIEEMDVRLARLAPEIVGDPKRSMFRIYRDIRFSSDKSPYKTHASCWFYHRDGSRGVGREAEGGGAGFYFQIAPGDSFVGGGMWMPPKDALGKIREAIAERPTAFKKIVDDHRLRRRFGGLSEEGMLKRVSRGYAADHPAAAWLRFQSLVVGRPSGERPARPTARVRFQIDGPTGALDQRRPGTQARAASLELEPAQVLEARPGARQRVSRLVVLHEPVLDAGLAGVREDSLPINTPLPHVRHDALRRFVGRGSPDHVLHVDERKATRIAGEVRHGVRATEHDPEEIELEPYQIRVRLGEQQVVRHPPVGEREELVVVVVAGELETRVPGRLTGPVQAVGDPLPVVGVASLVGVDPGADDELVTDEPGGVKGSVPPLPRHLVVHVRRWRRQTVSLERCADPGRRLSEIPRELHFAIPDSRDHVESAFEVPLEEAADRVQLEPEALDPRSGGRGGVELTRPGGDGGQGPKESPPFHGRGDAPLV
jgi:uncharacterized protein (TIGR02453 family)